MKWQCKRKERYNKKTNWHDFFCMLPCRVTSGEGAHVWVWLETIERKGYADLVEWADWYEWSFEYRLKNK